MLNSLNGDCFHALALTRKLGQSEGQTLFTFLGIGASLILQFFGLVLHSWYVIRVDLDKCTTCAGVVMATRKVMDTTIVTEGFAVEESITFDVGLWSTYICTSRGRACVRLDLPETLKVYSHLQPYEDIVSMYRLVLMDGAIQCRMVVIMSLVCTFVTLITMTSHLLTSGRTNRQRIKSTCMWSAGFSGILSFASVVIAGRSFVASLLSVSTVSMETPWAMVAMTISGYACIFSAYHCSYTTVRKCKKQLQYWKYHFREHLSP